MSNKYQEVTLSPEQITLALGEFIYRNQSAFGISQNLPQNVGVDWTLVADKHGQRIVVRIGAPLADGESYFP